MIRADTTTTCGKVEMSIKNGFLFSSLKPAGKKYSLCSVMVLNLVILHHFGNNFQKQRACPHPLTRLIVVYMGEEENFVNK